MGTWKFETQKQKEDFVKNITEIIMNSEDVVVSNAWTGSQNAPSVKKKYYQMGVGFAQDSRPTLNEFMDNPMICISVKKQSKVTK
jgi:hypothetical protein